MKRIFLSILIALLLLALCFMLWKLKPHQLSLKAVAFEQLPGWGVADTKKSFVAFKISCNVFLKQDPNKHVGSEFVDLQAKDWQPACNEAQSINGKSNKEVKDFFQKWFIPVEFIEKNPVQGLFTGYYMPLLKGRLKKTEKYNVPLYDVPTDLVTINLASFDPTLANRTLVGRMSGRKIVPYYTRAEINKGAIKKSATVIAWLDSSIDRTFLEIQGSGIIELSDGTQLIVSYSGENGASYTSIAKVLIDQGVMTRDNASMQHIRSYLESNPSKIDPVLNQNKSFVFFNTLKNGAALGSQGVGLTPGYSLAVDRKWVPLGTPVWLDTTRPDQVKPDQQILFHRLMVAQDTGGAIKGVVRGDVYWGAGERATAIAGRMKNPGHYWLLLPKQVWLRITDKLSAE